MKTKIANGNSDEKLKEEKTEQSRICINKERGRSLRED